MEHRNLTSEECEVIKSIVVTIEKVAAFELSTELNVGDVDKTVQALAGIAYGVLRGALLPKPEAKEPQP